MEGTHTISGGNDENVEEGFSSVNNENPKSPSARTKEVNIKTLHACSEGCVPIPCMYHKIGKMIVWLGPKRPYNLKWPLTCFVSSGYMYSFIDLSSSICR